MNSYVKLGLAALMPVALSVILFCLRKYYNKDSKKIYWLSQIIIGILFGGLAIIGTEWGIPLDGAMVNCRDAAPLCAGLFFGAPAGIIAGVIGGVERWIAVAWGVGSYTRLACSMSTALAGIFAALLRVFMFDNKKPSWLISFAIGLIVEVFHLTMVFVTNFDTATKAANIVKICSVPMILANSLSVLLASFIIGLISKEDLHILKGKHQISDIIQRWLLLAVCFAFLITTLFMYQLQTNLTYTQTDNFLTYGIEDAESDVNAAVDDNMIYWAQMIEHDYSENNLNIRQLMELYDVSEINIVASNGIIIASSEPDYYGYDMKSGQQSNEFMCLTKNKNSYVQAYGPISFDNNKMMKYAGVALDGGFIQIGLDSEQFQKGISSVIKSSVANRRIGQSGFLVVYRTDGAVVSGPSNMVFPNLEATTINDSIKVCDTFERFEVNIRKTDYYSMYDYVEGYIVVAFYPQTEANQALEIALLTNTYLEILVFAIVFGIIYLLVKFIIVDKMRKINDSLAEITGGNLNVSVDVRSSEEFASLSDDINGTVTTLKHYIDEAAARIDKELEFAKKIQYSALPNVFPAFPKRKDFDIYARMDTAKEVGGDFYDFYLTHHNIINFLIADVSGKGIPAALFMMRAKTQLKSLTESNIAINDVFTRGNAGLCEGNDANLFVTAWQGQMNLETGLLEFANGGHNQPLVKKANGQFEYLKTRPGFVLAGMEGVNFKKQELQLEQGDIIFLYTDGVTEATDAHNELYGEDRLQTILNSREFTDMKDLCDTVKEDVDKFVAEAPQFDDITMLAFKFNGRKIGKRLHFDEASVEDIPQVTAFVEEELEKLECPMKAIMQLSIAIDELYSNIAFYSYPKKKGPATVVVEELDDPHGVQLVFIDEGIPYNPLKKEDPDTTLSVEDRGIGGLGIFMVKNQMDNMIYEYKDDKNILTIQKYY